MNNKFSPDNFTKTFTNKKGETFHYNKILKRWFWMSSLGWIPADGIKGKFEGETAA